MDVTRTLRLSVMAKEALASTPDDAGSAWKGLSEAYKTIRCQVAGMIPEDALKEFEELFPEEMDCTRATSAGSMSRTHVVWQTRCERGIESATRISGRLAQWMGRGQRALSTHRG